jgi:glycosyltransferase involved in cell wall biosynthesis
MNEKKKILLIAFKFPPYAGVGSFRWSKIAKYLSKEGYKIHVVTVKWNDIGADNLSSDVNHPNIIIHKIPSFYPHNFRYKRFKNTFFGNFLHIFRHIILKIINSIWYEDEAHHWGHILIPYCEKLINENNIKNVISTGHPFMANYWAAKLKKRNPNINLILDFRDPWNDVNERKIMFFRKKSLDHERFAVNNCDVVVAVTEQMLKGFIDKVEKNNIEDVVIPNGYDIKIDEIQKNKKRDFSFLYAGGMILGRQEPLKSFLKAVDELKEKVPELKAHFYGRVPKAIKREYEKLFNNGMLKEHKMIHPNKIMEKMHESFVCLHLNSKKYPMAVSTKIYEYAALKRPTLSINYDGEIDKLVKDYDLGISVNANNIKQLKQEILKLYEIWKKNPRYEINSKNIDCFHYRNIVLELERYFK